LIGRLKLAERLNEKADQMNSDKVKSMGLKGLINPCVAFTQVQAIE
jgi:hypothetical protein